MCIQHIRNRHQNHNVPVSNMSRHYAYVKKEGKPMQDHSQYFNENCYPKSQSFNSSLLVQLACDTSPYEAAEVLSQQNEITPKMIAKRCELFPAICHIGDCLSRAPALKLHMNSVINNEDNPCVNPTSIK